MRSPRTNASPKSAGRRQGDTRMVLVRAAERLFAARGVDNVSMREIAAAAGQANHSAVLYYFTDKHELLDALLQRHSEPIQNAWLIALDHMAAEGRDGLDELVGLLARPIVAKVDDPDGGPEYLQVVADLMTSRSHPILSFPAANGPGAQALAARMMRHLEVVPAELLSLRMLRITAALYCSIEQYLMARDSVPREEFVRDLIVSIAAMLRAGLPPR